MYVNRTYRDTLGHQDLKSFRVVVRETDLQVRIDRAGFDPGLEKKVEKLVLALRYDLETYLDLDPEFRTTLRPHLLAPGAPAIARTMAAAASAAGVGPMAAVAGAFAEFIGRDLLKTCSDVIVENGGDIFLASTRPRLVAIFAGASPFSNRLAVEILPEQTPLGICTSSGTVGPSLSLGKADAAVVLAGSTVLADAAASAAGNVIQRAGDVKKGVKAARKITGVLGAVMIKDDQLAVWGDFRLVKLDL